MVFFGAQSSECFCQKNFSMNNFLHWNFCQNSITVGSKTSPIYTKGLLQDLRELIFVYQFTLISCFKISGRFWTIKFIFLNATYCTSASELKSVTSGGASFRRSPVLYSTSGIISINRINTLNYYYNKSVLRVKNCSVIIRRN